MMQQFGYTNKKCLLARDPLSERLCAEDSNVITFTVHVFTAVAFQCLIVWHLDAAGITDSTSADKW